MAYRMPVEGSMSWWIGSRRGTWDSRWKRRLEPGTVHTIYVTSANPREIYLSIDEESYPVTLEDLISDWEAI